MNLVYTGQVEKGWIFWTATVHADPPPPLIFEGGSRNAYFRSRTKQGAIRKAREYVAKRRAQENQPPRYETFEL